MKLYRFRRINRNSLLELNTSCNWASDPRNTNDPFDLVNLGAYRRSGSGLFNFESSGLDNYYAINNAIMTFGITCYSSFREGGIYPFENPLMWSHYTDGHTGLCLVFDVPEIKFAEFIEVKYVDELPNLELLSSEEYSENINRVFGVKSKYWEYEQEVRELHDTKNQYYPFPGRLSEVIFGCRATRSDIELVSNILRAKNQDCFVNKMLRADFAFQLQKMEVDVPVNDPKWVVPKFF